jgi:hypothetical protein
VKSDRETNGVVGKFYGHPSSGNILRRFAHQVDQYVFVRDVVLVPWGVKYFAIKSGGGRNRKLLAKEEPLVGEFRSQNSEVRMKEEGY